jgi:hypothetical protein
MLPVMPLTMQPTLSTSKETTLRTQDKTQELSLLQSRLIVQKEANITA